VAPHSFGVQDARGATGEARVVEYLQSHGFAVERVTTLREQFEGIDLYATSPRTGERKRLEVKTDYRAAQTGNAAVETVSNDVTGRQGWALTTTADFVLYLVDGMDVLYWLTPAAIRAAVPRWAREYRPFAAQNAGYVTTGILVPLRELEVIAHSVVSL
jgi:hypothetical protein